MPGGRIIVVKWPRLKMIRKEMGVGESMKQVSPKGVNFRIANGTGHIVGLKKNTRKEMASRPAFSH